MKLKFYFVLRKMYICGRISGHIVGRISGHIVCRISDQFRIRRNPNKNHYPYHKRNTFNVCPLVMLLAQSKKYSDTLCLPRTLFPAKLEGKKRTERDKEIFEKCNFSNQYKWQRDNRNKSNVNPNHPRRELGK